MEHFEMVFLNITLRSDSHSCGFFKISSSIKFVLSKLKRDPSNNDKLLAYSIDTKGSEYFSIFIRVISDNKIIDEEIKDTSGNITWSYNDKFLFYSKLDQFHRPRKIYCHEIGTQVKNDKLIFEEKDERFTCGIGTSAD